MSGSNRNPNQPEHSRATCPSGQNTYYNAGWPLTLTDFNVGQAANRGHVLSNTEGSSQFSPANADRYSGRNFNPQMESTRHSLARARARAASANRSSYLSSNADSSQTSSLRPKEYSGRPFNPLADLSGKRLANDKESRLSLECEMARSKDKALERLRSEYAPNCDAPLRAQMARDTSVKRLDFITEVQGQPAQQIMPSECMRPARDNIRAGRRVDPDRVYNYNMQVGGTAVGRPGRSLDVDRDVTFRRLNLPTPKQQRATSCPTPLQHFTKQPSVQRMPKICPRPTQPICDPGQQIATRLASNKTKYPVTPMHSQVGPTTDTAVGGSPGTATTVTTTTTRPISPTQTSISPSPQQPSYRTPNRSPDKTSDSSPDSSRTPQGHREQRQDSTNISQINQDSIPEIYAPYGPTPPRGPPQQFFKTPGRPLNVTDQHANASLRQTDASVGTTSTSRADNSHLQTTRAQEKSTASTDQSLLRGTVAAATPPASPRIDPNSESYRAMQELQRLMDQSRSSRPRQSQTPQTYPTEESYYYNASMFDEPSHYRRQAPTECPASDYIDLTEDTQYECNDMDISEQDLPAYSTQLQQETSRRMQSWRIPPEDMTCIDISQQPDGAEFDSTEYMQLPSSLSHRPYCPPQMQEACEQPRASLFRCLAQKLSSTYNFISSLVAPQRSAEDLAQALNQPAGQVCEASAYGQNTMFGTKTQMMDEPASVRECANAKSCGRVQFDSSDRHELQDPHRRAIQKAETENLVNDAYCPGIIQDTIDGRDNFNDLSFNLYSALDPRGDIHSDYAPIKDPMTLLEAFVKRIEKERAEINKDIKENCTEEKLLELIHQHFENLNPSDLNRSIKSFLLSESLQDREQIEKSKGISWEADVQKAIANWPDNTEVKVITYTGRTTCKRDDK